MERNKKEKTKRKSIRKKLMLGMAALTVAICVVLGASASIVLYKNANTNMINSVDTSASAYNRYVQKSIEKYEALGETIAQNRDITDDSKSTAERKEQMAKLAEKYGFVEVMVADSSGHTSNNTDVAERDYFKKAITGKTCISSTLVRKTDSTITMMIAAKVDNGTSYDGIIIAVLSSDTFSKIVDEISVGQSGYGFIVDKDGKIIAHKERSNVTDFVNYIEKAKKDSSYADVAALVKNMTAGKSGTQKVSFQGTSQVIGYSPISDTDGWSIAVSANENEMMSEFYTSVLFTIILTIIMIILSLLFANKIAGSIANPISMLIQRIQMLAQGDLHSEVPKITSGDEIGVLAQSCENMTQTLNLYVSEISDVMEHLAKGDCTVETRQEYRGDFQQIESSLNIIIGNLNRIFITINTTADLVASGAEQVSGAAQALSQGAEEQASSVEELSATITDIAGEVTKNAANASTASKYSMDASAEVERGDRHMEDLVGAMTEISDSSNQISRIIKVIEDIAFQTNILALNAAVEAARAGEAGKGFSVVADEVRNLASKSAQAAKNTTELIQSSIRAVENGTKIAGETADSLKSIVEGAKKTTDLISEISVASNHQATAIHEVTQGVDQISAVVQTNSATSEESAATSEELSAQAQGLKSTLAFLKLKEVDSDKDSKFSSMHNLENKY